MSFEAEPGPETNTDISCANCVAACCRAGATLMMTKDEASQHRRAMQTKVLMRPKDYPQRMPLDQSVLDEDGNRVRKRVMAAIPRKYGFYILLTDCGHIAEDFSCNDYENRPESCRSYEVGSEACLDARATFGLDGHEQTAQFNPDKPITVIAPKYHQA